MSLLQGEQVDLCAERKHWKQQRLFEEKHSLSDERPEPFRKAFCCSALLQCISDKPKGGESVGLQAESGSVLSRALLYAWKSTLVCYSVETKGNGWHRQNLVRDMHS